MLKKIKNAVFMLTKDPTSFFSRIIFETKSILSLSHNCVQRRINGVLFEFDFGYTTAVRNMLLGKYEIKERSIMKKILQPGDIFIDVGANIGYLSAIAAGLVGKTGAVHSFEPVPDNFRKLQQMVDLNPDYKIIINQCALGEIEGTAQIDVSAATDRGLNTMVSGYMQPETKKETIEILVKRLDNYIKEHNLNKIALIKIDVEGFEFLVLKGLRDFLVCSDARPPIMCEITPSAYIVLGCQLIDLFDYMKDFSYYAFDADDPGKELNAALVKKMSRVNVLFKQII